MFAIMPTPIFTFDAAPLPPASTTPLQQQPKYRPSVSSPLSSSPIRASSYSPPISPHHDNTVSSIFPPRQSGHLIPRDTQSSPIAQPSSPSPSRKLLFKFAARTPRPNPVVQKREEARESRRKLFLKNVRERGDDRAWERRGGDQEVLKLEWWRLNNELRQQKDAELAVFGTDADIEEAVQLQELRGGQERLENVPQPEGDIDDMMADAIAREEEAEIEALLSSMPPPTDGDGDRDMHESRPESVYFSDEDDYDALFMELSQQEQPLGMGSGEDMVFSQDTEMT
ncbi:hypothetical protein CONLIGDRAFT_403491 [Coniochaeta ligniaria NRRL 30616]|uniref:Uncharacterized protein n=1 Tax=Coniochaeta ligniaria NRRL 30616 TaxID=1408157 RepID=A0A1J7JIA1_9PEZI|nr:hypothetical protein CONLIGDRAFT_403491 [Coniochaeta ligniaria NRRL 30616]